MFIDYTELNQKLMKDKFPLPLIEDVLNTLQEEKQKEAFEKLKKIMSEGPILHLYKYGRKTELHADACKQGYGAILLQKAEDGMLHPVYYMSKKTNTAEENRKTEEIVKQEFFIPNLTNVVKKVIVNCVPCILANKKTGKKEGFWNPISKKSIPLSVPRGNGQVERIHRTLIPVLTKLSLDDSTKWYKYVNRLQRILNSTICRSTKWTPFELLVGTKMRNKEDIIIKDLLLEEMAKELLEEREFLRNDAKKNIETLQSENRKTYNRKRGKASLYTKKVI
ncbi:transposon Tf2-9 polyprotein [Trichonephila clavipes]|nr:transposon Tf2-9 polyprotein [Trichonephila clavipes]